MPGKRVFFVCKSKNCGISKRTGVRCTISMMESAATLFSDQVLNERMFCLFEPMRVTLSFTPKWVRSVDKPGERNKIQTEKKYRDSYITDHPEFLEVN